MEAKISAMRLVLCVILTMPDEAFEVDPLAAGDDHGSLREAGDELVRAVDGGVGAGRHGVGRQGVAEAQVRAPGLVDDERHAGGVRRRRHALEVGADAVVVGGAREDGGRRRLLGGRDLDRPRRHTERDLPLGVHLRLDVVWHGAREHDAGEQRLVRVARYDQRLVRPSEEERQRMHAAGRSVDQEPRLVPAVRLGGEPLGLADVAGGLARVLYARLRHGVGLQGARADRLDEPLRSPLADLVAGRVEGDEPQLAIPDDGVDVRGLVLVEHQVLLPRRTSVAPERIGCPRRGQPRDSRGRLRDGGGRAGRVRPAPATYCAGTSARRATVSIEILVSFTAKSKFILSDVSLVSW